MAVSIRDKNREDEMGNKLTMHLTKEMAQELCDSIELYSDFFDVTNEEYILLKANNPKLLTAYETIFTIANSEV